MSALGQKQTFDLVPAMSALPPKADIAEKRSATSNFVALATSLNPRAASFACRSGARVRTAFFEMAKWVASDLTPAQQQLCDELWQMVPDALLDGDDDAFEE